jgi:hypothetical protein
MWKRAILITSVALALTAQQSDAARVRYPDVPRRCVIVGVTNPEDEGFPVAKCKSGKYIYADMDGNGRNPKSNGRWCDATFYVSLGIYPAT